MWRTNQLQTETNRLLEQMRRAQLTPAERAREDAESAAARAPDNKITLVGLLIVGLFIGWIVIGSACSPAASAVPRAELVKLPNRQ